MFLNEKTFNKIYTYATPVLLKYVKLFKNKKLDLPLPVQFSETKKGRSMTNDNNAQNIFARFRTNNCGGSQLFDDVEEALSWVQSSTRSTVESGYSKADFTVADTEGHIYYKGYTTKTKYCYDVYSGKQRNEIINYQYNNKQSIMKENNFTQASSIFDAAENEVKEVAAETMKVAIASKKLSDEEFADAIKNASKGLVIFRRSAHNPERVDFCSWKPYAATHKKKDPGKKRFNAIERTIIDTYQRGRSMKSECVETFVAADKTKKAAAKDFIGNVVNIVLVYMHEDEIVKKYLQTHGSGIASELSILTRGIIVGSAIDGRVELRSSTGKSVTITTDGRSLNDVSRELTSAVTLLLTQAALYSQTRNAVECMIDVDELSELYFSAPDINQTGSEQNFVSEQDTPTYSYDEIHSGLETSTTMPVYSTAYSGGLQYIVRSIPTHQNRAIIQPPSSPAIPRGSVKRIIKRY